MIRKDIEILKKLFSPVIEELSQLVPAWKQSVLEETFWDNLNLILFDNTKTSDFLQKQGIPKADYFLDRFKELRKEYISNLANEYCSGATNPTVERLLNSGYKLFIDEVSFQQNIKQAVTISEMDHLKKKLSLLDARAAFEIGDKDIIAAFELAQKKNEHEAIKEKMLAWGKTTPSLANKPNVIPINNTSQAHQRNSPPARKTISLTFIRYAAAACFVGVMVWIGVKFYNQPKENNIVAIKSDTLKTPPVASPKPQFAKVETATIAVPIVKETGIGFAQSQKEVKLKIVVEDVAPRIQSIERYLSNVANDTNQTEYRAAAIHELDSLKRLAVSYTFDGTALRLFASLDVHHKNAVVKTADKQYFLTDGNNFYFIKNTPEPLELIKSIDPAVKEKLERLIFNMK
jgi:hypothetical protein